ncbi:NucA/NucB deoxyribonuclease domain-containing protein [Streptomyces sp. NPDC001407]|uniref:NucA/NucB deoxyribonuclease domain-containing protein n=1 Tax=Streptomyces sp. NPDC001407 TaxID=3364573 RepID=UPI0036964BD9
MHWPIRRALTAALVGAACTALPATYAAAQPAVSTAGGIATTPVQVVDAAHPLPALGSRWDGDRAPEGSAQWREPAVRPPAALHEHGDVTAQRLGTTYTSTAEERSVTAAGVDLATCRRLLPRSGERILNHYAYCHVTPVGYSVVSGGKVIGTVSWRNTTAGDGTRGSRVIRLVTGMDEFVRTGVTTDGKLSIGWATSGYHGPDGSNKACDARGSGPELLSGWQAGGTAIYTISSAASDGYGRDKVARCAIRSSVTNSGGTGTVLDNGVRFDSANYLGSNGAGIFDRVMPVMGQYGVSSTRNGAVARHIQLAQTNPGATYPPPPAGHTKSIPGGIASGKPLHRLVSNWDAAAAKAYAKNRSVVRSTCAPLRHQAGEECDEYPFASSWEGAGKGDGNFSVKYVDGTQNGNAGTDLNNWYVADRILHNDAFYVVIH